MVNKHDHHDWHSPEYVDDWVRRSREDDARRTRRFQLMADLVPFPRDAAIRILDVGAGYGPVTGFMLESFPNARVVAHDYSGEMLRHARAILAPFGDRVTFHTADLLSDDWAKECEGPYEAVVSSIAIHNLQSAPRIRQLYAEICSLVRDGGCFLNIDLVSAPTPGFQRAYWESMARQRRASAPQADTPGSKASPPSASTEEADEVWPPFPASMEQQLAWLREAGFPHVDCFWKEMGMVLVGGFK